MVQTILGPAIPKEWIEKIRTDVIKSARYANMARRITKVRPLGDSLGIQTWSYDKQSEVGDAELTWALTDVGEDVIGLTRASKNIPVLHKEFRITGRDLEACRLGGFPISTQTAESAAYKVAILENQIIFGGYSADGSNYEIDGFYRQAGNSYGTSKDFGTAGNAIAAVAGAVDLLMADLIYPPYNLVLNPTQAIELQISILGSGVGEREIGVVRELLGGGDIIVTPFQTAGTGMMLTPPSTGHHEILVAKDLTVQTLLDEWTGDLKGRVYEAITPIVYETNSICKLTTI
jgi:uncharacterized linocin/CFP29 family protein